MKCGEPKPGSTYQACDEELRHSGDHAYLGQLWPRVKPARPDYDVAELLDAMTPRDAWGVMERSFPIVVTETIVRVVWVEAESEDAALAYWGEDPTEMPSGGEVLDGSLEFERPDKWQRQEAFRANRFEAKIGPLLRCPGCRAESFRQAWFHDPYRKCHGPIRWKATGIGRPWREHEQTPVHSVVEAEATR